MVCWTQQASGITPAQRWGNLGCIFLVFSIQKSAMLCAQKKSASSALEKQITAIAAGWDIAVQARTDSSVHALKKLLLRQPVVTVALVAAELRVSEPAADTSIQKLVNAGILIQSSTGRRNRHWQATEILGALDSFGARARRARSRAESRLTVSKTPREELDEAISTRTCSRWPIFWVVIPCLAASEFTLDCL
jgi:hypothetical protein